ncbi:hypothetical protein Tco_0787781 [Tanacetum coccineum]
MKIGGEPWRISMKTDSHPIVTISLLPDFGGVTYQLHLDEEALRETLEEQAMDAKAREEKIRQKQVDDDEFFLTFGRVRIDSHYESSD